MGDSLGKTVVIHFTKCTDSTTLASARIAKFIKNKLSCQLIDDKSRCNNLNYDRIFIVNSPFAFCNFRDYVKNISKVTQNVIWIQNDFNIKIPSCIKYNAIWTSVENNVKNDKDNYINWNLLSWFPDARKIKVKNKFTGLFYYGAYRSGREEYFRKYFVDVPYNVHISASQKAVNEFRRLNKNCNFYKPFKDIRQIINFDTAIYIEDIYSHKNYCSPANRFFEYLSCGLAILFDINTFYTFNKFGIDISPYIVENANDVNKMLMKRDEIINNQWQNWNKNYSKILDNEFNELIGTL